MTGLELDELLAPETEAQEATQEQQTEDKGQPRDEHGKFAQKAQEPQTEQQTETHVEDVDPEQGKVPQQALHASRQKEKEARSENEQLRREIAEMRGQLQMLSRQPQAPAKPTEQAKTPDFYEDPDAYLESKLNPVQKTMQQQHEQFSKMLATQAHGKDTVDAAYNAFVQAAQANPQAYAGEYQSIMSSEHPYDALVGWHKRQETLKTVGNDPNAWLEAEMEKRLNDPAYQAKVLERIRGATTADPNRSVTTLPPSLSRLPSGGNTAADNDMSDAALFSNALR